MMRFIKLLELPTIFKACPELCLDTMKNVIKADISLFFLLFLQHFQSLNRQSQRVDID